jgi:hypothetical protein
MYRREDSLKRLYGVMLCPTQVPHLCDQLQALPHPLFSVVLAGFYRSAPAIRLKALVRSRVRAAFTDQAGVVRRPLRLRCSWRVRCILEEYGFSNDLFYPFPSETVTWLTADRFVQSRGVEFWSLAYCLTIVGLDPGRRSRPAP